MDDDQLLNIVAGNGTATGTTPSLMMAAAISQCSLGTPMLDRPAVRVPFIIAYVSVFFLCLIGNMFTILVICAHQHMRTATNFFLANLAVADLLVAIFCILQNMLHLVGTASPNNWPLGEPLCKLYAFVLHVVPCTSIGILVCVSVEKYIAVLHPLLALKALTPRFRLLMMAAIWAISLLFNIPYYRTTKKVNYADGRVTVCTRVPEVDSLISSRNMITLSFFLWYCIPLCTIAFLYTRIGLVLWHSAPLNKLTQLAALRTSSNETTTFTAAQQNGGQKRSLITSYRMSASAATAEMANGFSRPSSKRSNSQPVSHGAVLTNLLPMIRVNRSTTLGGDENSSKRADHHLEDEEELEEGFFDEEEDEESVAGGGAGADAGKVRLGNGSAAVVPASCSPTPAEQQQQQQQPGTALLVSTVESRKKIIRLLIAIVFSFAVLTLPHHARLLYTSWSHNLICLNQIEGLIQPATYLFLFLSSSCNPFLYAFMSQRFRSAIRDIFKCSRRGRARRKSTRTRTQNSDIMACALSSACEPGPGGGENAISRCSSLTRLNYSSEGGGGAGAGHHPQMGAPAMANGHGGQTGGGGGGLLTAAGSERNLLLVNQQMQQKQQQPRGSGDSGNHLKVQPLGRKSDRSASGGSTSTTASTASSVVCTTQQQRSNSKDGPQTMAVVYRKAS